MLSRYLPSIPLVCGTYWDGAMRVRAAATSKDLACLEGIRLIPQGLELPRGLGLMSTDQWSSPYSAGQCLA